MPKESTNMSGIKNMHKDMRKVQSKMDKVKIYTVANSF